MQFLFYLGLPHGLASEETNAFILCACFCFATGPIPVNVSTTSYSCSREISRRPTRKQQFSLEIIFTDLKKVRFNYHWPLRLNKKNTMTRF